jgi:hypothetical protein
MATPRERFTSGLTISEREMTSTLEERAAYAELLSGRVAGPGTILSFDEPEGWTPRAAEGQGCARCGGELRCPNCGSSEGNSEPDGSAPYKIPSATDGRSALVGRPRLDDYREKALVLSPSAFSRSDAERSSRKALAAQREREEAADLERRPRMTNDWRAELQSAAEARHAREAAYRGYR